MSVCQTSPLGNPAVPLVLGSFVLIFSVCMYVFDIFITPKYELERRKKTRERSRPEYNIVSLAPQLLSL